MKVLMINGSPHEKGCTFTALSEVAKELTAQGIESEILWIGPAPVGGCIGCNGCVGKGGCVFDGGVNAAIEKAKTADAIILGSPVHYASAAGSASGFFDRLFYAGGAALRFKPGAAVVSARRGGSSATFDQLNKYFTINNMPVVGSQYWNQVHGSRPEDVAQDLEGMQTMRQLARNMAWLLKSIEAGRAAGLPLPATEERARTNFIR